MTLRWRYDINLLREECYTIAAKGQASNTMPDHSANSHFWQYGSIKENGIPYLN